MSAALSRARRRFLPPSGPAIRGCDSPHTRPLFLDIMRAIVPVVVSVALSTCGVVVVVPSFAQTAESPRTLMLDQVQVTATRFGEPTQEVPGSISVVTGEDLRARGATDLRTALSLLSGVSVAPISDAGPAGAVPNLLGIREVDDLLLLIDGIPAGGIFVPQVEAISLDNVERIEVLRGAAPVYFGTTAFAGTINIIHYAAGRAENALNVRYGSYGSVGANASGVLSTGEVRQSISGALDDQKLSDPRAGYKRAQGSYRLATELGSGTARADVNILSLRQKPTSPTPVDPITHQLTTLLPVDFNQNPQNGKRDTERYQLVLGYDLPLAFGTWGSTLAYTRTHNDIVRSFIDTGDTPPPWTSRTIADTEPYKQSQRLGDLFVDSHVTTSPLADLDVTVGFNVLLGHADVDSVRYSAKLLLDGNSSLPSTDALSSKGTVALTDRRRFLGAYIQSRYKLTPDASLLAGLRWNDTHETQEEVRVNSRRVVTTTDATQNIDRLSGSFGAQWTVLRERYGPIDGVTLHGSVGNTFQPAQIDFGPNPEAKADGGGLLKPETQRSVVAGARVDALHGFAEFDVDTFFVNFDNQPIQASAGGTAVLRPGGKQRYKGVDVEVALHPATDWTVKANATWSDARYRDFVTDVDGIATQLSGKRQVMTPRLRGGAGILYVPARGLRASLTTTFIGPRYLDQSNTARVGGFNIVDASIGYRFDRYTLTVSGNNLTDRRDPILVSELGDGQFYRMPSRRVDATLSVAFR